jgi:hypothetical protein
MNAMASRGFDNSESFDVRQRISGLKIDQTKTMIGLSPPHFLHKTDN